MFLVSNVFFAFLMVVKTQYDTICYTTLINALYKGQAHTFQPQIVMCSIFYLFMFFFTGLSVMLKKDPRVFYTHFKCFLLLQC